MCSHYQTLKDAELLLQKFGVRFNVYYLESSLYADKKVDATVQALVASLFGSINAAAAEFTLTNGAGALPS